MQPQKREQSRDRDGQGREVLPLDGQPLAHRLAARDPQGSVVCQEGSRADHEHHERFHVSTVTG
jgi:hypothetical protein